MAAPKGQEPWRRRAACSGLGPGIFYPGRGEGEGPINEVHYLVGKTVCARCPVLAECDEYAEANGEDWGLWGGLTPRERYNRRHGIR